MKRKIGTILEDKIIQDAKHLALRERRPLANVIQEAVVSYLSNETARGDALRACEKFCSHGRSLSRNEIDDLLREDPLAP